MTLPIRDELSAEALTSANLPLLDGLRLLVVDDDPDTRCLFALALEEDGAEVIVAASADEALNVVEQHQPDVVVSDILMPHATGYDLIRQVKDLDARRGKQTLAIAVTALAGYEHRTRALEAGFSGYLPKPVNIDNLSAIVAILAGRAIAV
ncbi:MAG: response regulator [Leptolyngbyaceae cyanobacterium SL_5_9]|nr:response regulator [Leptolyngbyaceae cyanobacterium SL_5_9]NJO75201.1 response regulator [Leptolyngbyaceae cyanobacterium RM1_406_9]